MFGLGEVEVVEGLEGLGDLSDWLRFEERRGEGGKSIDGGIVVYYLCI